MMPSLLLHGAIMLGGAAVTVLAGMGLSRYWTRRLAGRQRTDVLSSYVGVIGTLYAVLLAFVLLSVWEQYDTARSAAEREASELSDLVRLSDGLPGNGASQVRAAVRDYASAVVDDEWPLMRVGGRSARADRALDALWKAVIGIDPPGGRAQIIYDQALERLRSASDSRQDRLSQAKPSVHAVIWILLIGGGALSLISTYLFEVGPTVYMPVNIGLTLMIAFILYLVFAFDHPFSYDVGTGPQALRAVLTALQ
jgi:hypothetical protein